MRQDDDFILPRVAQRLNLSVTVFGLYTIGENRESRAGGDHGKHFRAIITAVAAHRGYRGADGYGLFSAGSEATEGQNDFVALQRGRVANSPGESDVGRENQFHLRTIQGIL